MRTSNGREFVTDEFNSIGYGTSSFAVYRCGGSSCFFSFLKPRLATLMLAFVFFLFSANTICAEPLVEIFVDAADLTCPNGELLVDGVMLARVVFPTKAGFSLSPERLGQVKREASLRSVGDGILDLSFPWVPPLATDQIRLVLTKEKGFVEAYNRTGDEMLTSLEALLPGGEGRVTGFLINSLDSRTCKSGPSFWADVRPLRRTDLWKALGLTEKLTEVSVDLIIKGVEHTDLVYDGGVFRGSNRKWSQYEGDMLVTEFDEVSKEFSRILVKDKKPAYIDFLGKKVQVLRTLYFPAAPVLNASTEQWVEEYRPESRPFKRVERQIILAAEEFSVTTKSFISHMASENARSSGILDDDTSQRLGFDAENAVRLQAFELLLLTDTLFSENPTQPDASSGQFRLWSNLTGSARCAGSTLKIVRMPVLTSAFGTEGPLPAKGEELLPLTTSEVQSESKMVSITYRYGIKGRPHFLALPAFEAVRPRTCTWIWHMVEVAVSCKDGLLELAVKEFSGSSFPSHRIWVNGAVRKEIAQASFENLWRCQEANPSMVR